MTLTLSRRMIGDADRVGGIELMIPWPTSGPPMPRDLADGDERPAGKAELAWTYAALREACAANGLVITSVRAARVPRDRPAGIQPVLAAVIVGRRWLHATTSRVPREAWLTTPVNEAGPKAGEEDSAGGSAGAEIAAMRPAQGPENSAKRTDDSTDSPPRKSPADLLADAGRALYGERWRIQLARYLDICDETIRRWMSGHTRLTMEYDCWPLILDLLAARARDIAASENAIAAAQKK